MRHAVPSAWLSGATACLLDFVYPRTCALCGGRSRDAGGHVCWSCRAGIDLIRAPFCRTCGDPADGVTAKAYRCSACGRRPPSFDAARSAARFRGSLRVLLHAFKYRNMTFLADDMARLAVAAVRTHYAGVRFDAATCVPLHGRRRRERSYNQSELIGRRVAAILGLPFDGGALRRTRFTRSQTRLNARERRANVRDAFAVRSADWSEGRRYLLVDDVMTTGATVHACAAALARAGAASVHAVTVARG